MLRKFVIHAKNIVFFKILSYSLIIGILISLLIFSRANYNQAKIKHQHMMMEVAAAEAKLLIITQPKSNILNSLQLYQNVSNVSKSQSCDNKIKLIENIENVGRQFNLSKPITTKFTQIYSTKEGRRALQFKIKYYELSTEFAVSNFDILQETLKAIHELLPQDSLIISLNIRGNEFLDPVLISELTEQAAPNFFKVKLIVKIRELYQT
ncbi:MAG: hypothetical protein EOP33_04595 [Rickettsiaceae bacterium]|nr:MAG: hypothetical protein EOP33_04595 [Rickettsiaceae bacterium]